MWINPVLVQIWILGGRRCDPRGARLPDASTSAGGVKPRLLPSRGAWCRGCRAARAVMRACAKLYAFGDTPAMVSHNFAYKELAHGDAVGSGSGLACACRTVDPSIWIAVLSCGATSCVRTHDRTVLTGGPAR